MSSRNKPFLSGYASSLSTEDSKKRYKEKLDTINGIDPYETSRTEWLDDVDLWPSITSVHIAMYLLITPSPYTGNDLLNYKSMDCYNNFLSGWVREILVKVPKDDIRVVISKVNHSQRMCEKPLTPWIIAEVGGKIIAGHCNCMAGLGESCSHVAAMLWAIESGIRLRESMTVTQKKAYWVIPNNIKEVPYAPVKEIKFLGKSHSVNRVTPTPSGSRSSSPSCSSFSSRGSTPINSTPKRQNSLPPTDEEFDGFLKALSTTSSKPAILSLVEPYSSDYIPKSLSEDLPICLLDLRKPEYLRKDYGELLLLAKQCLISVTNTNIQAVESKTRLQSKSDLWLRMRSGRITASKFLCCGEGVCEFKCPYSHRDDSIEEAAVSPHFCLDNSQGKLELKKDHAYYYQVQCQMFCTKRSYCDFVVWTKNDVHIERIYPDETFWHENVLRATHFFQTAILPELLGKFYSRTQEHTTASSSSSASGTRSGSSSRDLTPSVQTYCYCNEPDEGDREMIGCDNPNCERQWFHIDCLGLKSLPKSRKWFCPECRKLPEFQAQCKKRKIAN